MPAPLHVHCTVVSGQVSPVTVAVICDIFQRSHSLRTLSDEWLRDVAKMSEDHEQFNREILKPFLRTRVSDTEGNRAVREVCFVFVE